MIVIFVHALVKMKRYALITGLLSGLLFGVATPLGKLLLKDLNSFQLAGLLYLGAGIAMIPFIFRSEGKVRMLFNRRNSTKTWGIIFFGGILGPVLLLAGLKTANAASVSIWLNMELVATAVLGVLFFKDHLDKYAWTGVGLTVLAGVVTSVGEGVSGLVPALFVMAACVCWGIDNHLTALSDGTTPQAVTFVKGIIAGCVNITIGFLLAGQQPVEIAGISVAVLVGIFSYGISIVLYVTAAQNIGATRSQILFSTAPLWGVLLSAILFSGSFQAVHIISMILLALAIMLTNSFTHQHRHTHLATEHIHLHRHDDGHHDHSHEGIDVSGKKWHTHLHTHNPVTHTHKHSPDLHHRHDHSSE